MNNIKFATLTMEQKLGLNDLTIDRVFVTEDEVTWITNFLNLTGKTVDELRAIRNSVVKHYHMEEENLLHDNFESVMQIMANMSGVTCVIDHAICNLGGEV